MAVLVVETILCNPRLSRLRALAAIVAVMVSVGCRSAAGVAPVRINYNTELSEDEGDAARLHASLSSFWRAVVRGEHDGGATAPQAERRHALFDDALRAIARRADAASRAPVVLKSYSPDGESYLVTVAFFRSVGHEPQIDKIIEFHAQRDGDGYRFGCPFDYCDSLPTHQYDGVTFHARPPFDQQRAAQFARFKNQFEQQLHAERRHLDYYCFASLHELLEAHGIVYDASKCNSLAQDLGFLDGDGDLYLTGTGDERYLFGFVRDYVRQTCGGEGDLFAPFVNGMAAYYGGYGLSGDDMPTLKQQFRARLANDPDFDFLHEFQLGRRSSVNRHFTYYVVCALLCEEVVTRFGFDEAMQLARSGADGERFFARLHSVLGVKPDGFHELIVRLISA